MSSISKMTISDMERLNLKSMIRQHGVVDNTDAIRELRHSDRIAADLLTINRLFSAKETTTVEEYEVACPFLYRNYTDIFHRAVNRELNIGMFAQFLQALKMIEDGQCDVHEGSLLVGKLLKEVYIDSAMRRQQKIDDAVNAAAADVHRKSTEAQGYTAAPTPAIKEISWTEYKQLYCHKE